MKILVDNGHGIETPGKRSPDGKFREYAYNRTIARRVVADLQNRGIDAELLVTEENDVPLKERCRRANAVCDAIGSNNVLLISIHVNAAGGDGQWHNATGWSAYTTPGTTRSDSLANDLCDAARKYLPGKKIRTDFTDGDPDIEENFYILCHTKCAAVLTENLFMDNSKDVEFLMSVEGRRAIASIHVEAVTNYILPDDRPNV